MEWNQETVEQENTFYFTVSGTVMIRLQEKGPYSIITHIDDFKELFPDEDLSMFWLDCTVSCVCTLYINILIILFIFELFLIYTVCTNLVNAHRFCALSTILSLSLLWRVLVVMVALVFNNQVNKNAQYKLLKLFVASSVGFHNSIKSLCKSFHYFFSAVNVGYLCYVNYIHL